MWRHDRERQRTDRLAAEAPIVLCHERGSCGAGGEAALQAAEVGETGDAEVAELAPAGATDAPLDADVDEALEVPEHTPVVAVAESPGAPVPDPSNYSVGAGQRITVQAEETLGHYAEWLEVRASDLRRLNGMSAGAPLVIGRQKKLDFSRVTPEVFEQRRLEYHRTMQEEFFEAYVVSGTTTHQLRRGDSLWDLAHRRFEVPIWLLRQYNPDLDFASLTPGAPLIVPVVEPRAS